eukprot:8261951-Pyramimonas_sp.AAC.1
MDAPRNVPRAHSGMRLKTCQGTRQGTRRGTGRENARGHARERDRGRARGRAERGGACSVPLWS